MTLKSAILTIGRKRPAPCFYCVDSGIDGSESVGVCRWCEERMCEYHQWERGMCDTCAHARGRDVEVD